MYIDWKSKRGTNKKPSLVQEEKVLMHHDASEESILPPKATLSYNEKKEFESLMRQIAKGEERKHEINVLFQNPEISLEDIKKL